jgi:hypothetical protein
LKLEFLSATGKIILFPPAQFELQPQTDFFAKAFFLKPALPPPRGFFA